MKHTFLLARFFAVVFLALSSRALAADSPAIHHDSRYPFRTDFANQDLPWYMPKSGEFPPHHSDRRIGGELVSADFIHRTGQFRMTKTGELVDFTMPPYGAVNYLNAEGDLRDVPLGTFFLFFLNQDAHGNFTRLATMQDQYTMDAGHGFSFRLTDIKAADGKLIATKHKLNGKEPEQPGKEIFVTEATRIWKADKQIAMSDLAVGDEVLYTLTGRTSSSPGHCQDLYVGTDTHKAVTEKQAKSFAEFIKRRGMPAWIEKVDGNKLTVTLFTGDPDTFKQTWLGDFAIGKELRCCVANDELRTWNPPVDGERSAVQEVKTTGVDAYGTSGVHVSFTVKYMLEGFRKGRCVRIFCAGWPVKDPPYGESLMGYGYGNMKDSELVELTPKEYPEQFPFRTDYGNENLPWFQIKEGAALPKYSEHLMIGELMPPDAGSPSRSGKLRLDRTGEIIDFTLLEKASVRYLNADAHLSEFPPGTRCRFSMYQDEKGQFTRANLVTDEFSHLATNFVSYRVERINLNEGKISVAWQLPEVKNYNGDMEKPNDFGRCELSVSSITRVWKGDKQVTLNDLAIGDSLLANFTSEQTSAPSRCTDLWVGVETQQMATERQIKAHTAAKTK